jgi:predicted HTH domain antitoxin
MVMTLRMTRLLIAPDWTPVRVGFSHRRIAEAEIYRRIFGCEVVFGVPADYIVISMDDLERPFRFTSSPMRELLDAFLAAVSTASGSGLQRRIATTARELLPQGKASVTTVAEHLGMSSRQLQRELAEDGITFKRIVDDTYSSVIYQSQELDRKTLWMNMVARTLY